MNCCCCCRRPLVGLVFTSATRSAACAPWRVRRVDHQHPDFRPDAATVSGVKSFTGWWWAAGAEVVKRSGVGAQHEGVAVGRGLCHPALPTLPRWRRPCCRSAPAPAGRQMACLTRRPPMSVDAPGGWQGTTRRMALAGQAWARSAAGRAARRRAGRRSGVGGGGAAWGRVSGQVRRSLAWPNIRTSDLSGWRATSTRGTTPMARPDLSTARWPAALRW